MTAPETALDFIKTSFANSADLAVREISCGKLRIFFVYLENTIDKELLEDSVIKPLGYNGLKSPCLEELNKSLYSVNEVKEIAEMETLPQLIAELNTVILIDDAESYFYLDIKKVNMRSISEPPSVSVLKGPREGFIEDMKTNIMLIRRKIKSPMLTFQSMKIGKYSSTSLAIVYVRGIAKDELVAKIQKKLEAISIDGILDSSYVSHYLEEGKLSIFNSVAGSEKPDIVAAKLLEGRIAIIVDGSPIVVTIPYILFESIQDSYDYYINPWRSTYSRFIRFIGAFLTVLLPGVYVALTSFHYHLLPLKFLITLLNATNGIPFPPAIEMLIVLTIFEILNEASMRMPRYMGIALSVVGAIVLGDTAVKAGLISSPAVLIMALSAIGIFCMPDELSALSILRLLFYAVGSVLGLYGCIILVIIIITYLAGRKNYGAPYLSPFAPLIEDDLKDSFIKTSLKNMLNRPNSIPHNNDKRR